MKGCRARLVALAVAAALLLTACDPGIDVRIENQSDVDVYVFMSGSYSDAYSEKRPDTQRLQDASPVKAGKASDTIVGCYSDTTNWVIVLANNEEIYARSATRGQWLHSKARVVVEGSRGAYQVSDSLGADASQIPQDEVGKPTVLGLAFMVVAGVASTVGIVVAIFITIRHFFRYYISKTHS